MESVGQSPAFNLNTFGTEAKNKFTDKYIRCFFLVVGFSPITCLCFTLFGFISLNIGALCFILPAFLFALVIGFRHPTYGRLAIKSFLVGIAATLVYDCTRVPFLALGMWSDFIPQIGNLLLHDNNSHWIIGYSWRYFGIGGGMAIAFAMIYPLLRTELTITRSAIIFGMLIWLCLHLSSRLVNTVSLLLTGIWTGCAFSPGGSGDGPC
jgi:hypothetical protein